MKDSPRRSRRDVLAVVGVLLLAAGAFVALFFALRPTPVPNAGELPDAPVVSATPTPGASATPTAPPASGAPSTPAPGNPASAVSFLDVEGGSVAVRATAGDCGGTPPVVETSTDAGATWLPAELPADDAVGQILALDVISSEQIDLVALAGPDCEGTVLTSYTGGQFWQDYPDRLANASYIDPASSAVVVVRGSRLAAPCDEALGVSSSAQGTVVRCSNGSFVFESVGEWRPITPLALSGATFDQSDEALYVIGARPDVASCEGAAVSAFAADGSTFGGLARGCAPVDPTADSLAVGAFGESIWVWDGAVVARSADGGASWETS